MPKLYPGYRDEIQKKIVSEASAIFLAKGFKKTTMDDIAARLGVTKPAIYRYYKNKEELFFASITELALKEFNTIFSNSFASDDLMKGAGLYFDNLLEIDRKYPMIAQDVDFIFSRNDSLRKNIYEILSEGLGFLEEFFQEQKEKGNIRSDIDEEDLAVICTSLSKGLINNVNMGLDPAEAKRLWLLGFAKLIGIRTTGKK